MAPLSFKRCPEEEAVLGLEAQVADLEAVEGTALAEVEAAVLVGPEVVAGLAPAQGLERVSHTPTIAKYTPADFGQAAVLEQALVSIEIRITLCRVANPRKARVLEQARGQVQALALVSSIGSC